MAAIKKPGQYTVAQEGAVPSDKVKRSDDELVSELDSFLHAVGWKDTEKAEAFEKLLTAFRSMLMNELEKTAQSIGSQQTKAPTETTTFKTPLQGNRFAKRFFHRISSPGIK